jgi:hypothetical protein
MLIYPTIEDRINLERFSGAATQRPGTVILAEFTSGMTQFHIP